MDMQPATRTNTLPHFTPQLCIAACGFLFAPQIVFARDSIPVLKQSPQSWQEAWAGFDPRKDPLEVEVFKTYEQDGLVLSCVRFCIGTFKGHKSYMAGIYGYPKNGTNLPGLVHSHGGGGRAQVQTVIAHARRGYAVIAISWRVDGRYPKENELPPDANTDWGAVAGHQEPAAMGVQPGDRKYDPFPSARNTGMFLRVLAGRRAITFLEQQDEVNPEKLGFTGHSIGATITYLAAAADPRIKAASPSAGPKLQRDVEDNDLFVRTFSPNAATEVLKCPVMFLSPSQDHHCIVEDVEWYIGQLPSGSYRISRSVHSDHRSHPTSYTALNLWLDSHLKNDFKFPEHPEIQLELGSGNLPVVEVAADTSKPIAHVDIYYLRDIENRMQRMSTRYWRFAKGTKSGSSYTAPLNIRGSGESLSVWANVHYQIENPVERQLSERQDTYVVTTKMIVKSAAELQSSGVDYVKETTSIIESFGEDWIKEWNHNPNINSYTTFKFNHSSIQKPPNAVFAIRYIATSATSLDVRFNFSSKGVGTVLHGSFPVKASGKEETLLIEVSDLKKTVSKKGGARANLDLESWNDECPPVTFSMNPGRAGRTMRFLEMLWRAGE